MNKMINLDELLTVAGADRLGAEERAELSSTVYKEMEFLVGKRLSDGLTDEQLEEFEKLIDRDPECLRFWLTTHSPRFTEDPIFQKIQALAPNVAPAILVAEYAATKWLEVNRPDYQDVVRVVADELRHEVSNLLSGLAQPE
jgi:isocitrate lyase